MQARQLDVLQALGVDAYVPRARAAAAVVARPAPSGGPDWDALAEAVRGCRLCGLCETRTQTVFGVGNRQAAQRQQQELATYFAKRGISAA